MREFWQQSNVGQWIDSRIFLCLPGALTASSIQFQTNSAAFLSAVKEIAGQDTGLNVIDKAAQVRLKLIDGPSSADNILKVSYSQSIQLTGALIMKSIRSLAAGCQHSEGLQCSQRNQRHAQGARTDQPIASDTCIFPLFRFALYSNVYISIRAD